MNNQNNSSAPGLLPCPFCGGAARIESNRDWHKLRGDHDDDCVFVEPVTLAVPATDEQLAALVADWNRRATHPFADRVQGGLTLTDADIEGIAREHDVGWTSTLGSMVKFARAILSRQNSTPANAAAANGDGLDIEKMKDAMEVGLDAAREVAQNFHEAYRGYREAEHKQVDADVAQLNEALAMLKAAPAPTHQPAPQTSGQVDENPLGPCECTPIQRRNCAYCAGYGKTALVRKEGEEIGK